MKIYYSWFDWAYSHIASQIIKDKLSKRIAWLIWVPKFINVWQKIKEGNIWVLPVENSYAGSVHENLYNFLRYDYKIIGEITLEINHCILSKEKKLSNIKKVYSHPQALSQCHDFLLKYGMEPIPYLDTAGAAKMVSESDQKWIASISSQFAAQIYWLNIVKKSVQDQDWNSTRFFILAPKDMKIDYKEKTNKISIMFEARNIPASLYKCLWWFATNWINMTKIESLPALKGLFTYFFWIDFEGNLQDQSVKNSLEELRFFAKDLKILWNY